MSEMDLERGPATPPSDQAYGTFSQSEGRRDSEKEETERQREWGRGALAGVLLSALLSLVVVTSFVVLVVGIVSDESGN